MDGDDLTERLGGMEIVIELLIRSLDDPARARLRTRLESIESGTDEGSLIANDDPDWRRARLALREALDLPGF
jgi:hypothetical protein